MTLPEWVRGNFRRKIGIILGTTIVDNPFRIVRLTAQQVPLRKATSEATGNTR